MGIPSDPMGVLHIPVLLSAVLTGLKLSAGAIIVDCTLGGGGHSAEILTEITPAGRVLGLDADPAAVERNQIRFAAEMAAGQLLLAHANFVQLKSVATQNSIARVDGILLDLGVSSFQLGTDDRGFSFRRPGALDMRFDPSQGESAAELVNQRDERELADIIYKYGEERHSRRIAREIVAHRPITTTVELAQIVARAIGFQSKEQIHPATRTFQALRIAVNRELEGLEQVLPQAVELLKPGGRLVVISFHSLEDRIVKHWMQAEASDFQHDLYHPNGGVPKTPKLKIITRKPITADEAEIQQNPRSRSAKLRIAEKL